MNPKKRAALESYMRVLGRYRDDLIKCHQTIRAAIVDHSEDEETFPNFHDPALNAAEKKVLDLIDQSSTGIDERDFHQALDGSYGY